MCNKLRHSYNDILIPARKTLYELKLRRSSGNSSLLEIYKQIAELKEQQHVIAKMRRKGFMTEEKYQNQTAVIDGKIMKQNQELRKISRNSDEDSAIEQLDILIDVFEKMAEDMDCFDKELFTLIAEKMIILDNEKIEFHLIGGMRFTERIVRE